MVCPKCGSNVYDNRNDKASGAKSFKWPDFKCQNKACDWAQWPPKQDAKAQPQWTPAPQPAPVLGQPSPTATPSGGPSPRDTLIQELFWDSFDAVLAGIAKRRLVDTFKPEHLASLTATLFIQRSRG